MDIFLARFPFFPKMRLALPKYVELAMMRPSACGLTGEEIFFGAVQVVVELHGLILNDFQRTILLSVTDSWAGARRAAEMIAEAMMEAHFEPAHH
jgi:hypothetical protein